MSQNIALKDGDLIYVPRMVIGDINEFIANISPLMDFFTARAPSAIMNGYMNDTSKLKF